MEAAKEVLECFCSNDGKYVRYLRLDTEQLPILCAASRKIPELLRKMLWDREEGMSAILTSGTLKAGAGFFRTRQITGLEGGVSEINIKDCTFQNLPRVMQCMPWKNQNTATQYPMIYNHITQEEYQRIASQNKVLRGVDVPYIIVNTRYNDYNYPEKYYF